MTATATEAAPAAPASDSMEAFGARLVEAGAPPLPGDLQYFVQYVPWYTDSVKVILDIRTRDRKRLLASWESTFQRKQLKVQDFVAMAKIAVDQLSFESKLPKSVQELLLG